jgi:hypothetical protein
MGLPVGAAAPIERRDRDGDQAACVTRTLRLARLAVSTASPLNASWEFMLHG